MLLDVRRMSPHAKASLDLLRRPWSIVSPQEMTSQFPSLPRNTALLRQEAFVAVCAYTPEPVRTIRSQPTTPRLSHLTVAIDLSRQLGASIPDWMHTAPVLCSHVDMSDAPHGHHLTYRTAWVLSRAFAHTRFVKGNRATLDRMLTVLYSSRDSHTEIVHRVEWALAEASIRRVAQPTRVRAAMPHFDPDHGWHFFPTTLALPTTAHGWAVWLRLLTEVQTRSGQQRFFS